MAKALSDSALSLLGGGALSELLSTSGYVALVQMAQIMVGGGGLLRVCSDKEACLLCSGESKLNEQCLLSRSVSYYLWLNCFVFFYYRRECDCIKERSTM